MQKLLFTLFICFLSVNAKAQNKDSLVMPVVVAADKILHISLRHDTICYDNDPIGMYRKKVIDNELISVVVYNMNKNRLAEATYITGEENWTVATPVDQNKMYSKHTESHALEVLFQFLVDKKYL